MAMTRRALLRALLVAPFTPRAIPTVLADRATGISIRFIKAFDIKVDPRPTRLDLWYMDPIVTAAQRMYNANQSAILETLSVKPSC